MLLFPAKISICHDMPMPKSKWMKWMGAGRFLGINFVKTLIGPWKTQRITFISANASKNS